MKNLWHFGIEEDLFYEDELAAIPKGFKNNMIPGTYCVVSKFFKHGGCAVRDKLLMIMNVTLEKGKYLAIVKKL